jgi:hypothetical protein
MGNKCKAEALKKMDKAIELLNALSAVSDDDFFCAMILKIMDGRECYGDKNALDHDEAERIYEQLRKFKLDVRLMAMTSRGMLEAHVKDGEDEFRYTPKGVSGDKLIEMLAQATEPHPSTPA